MLLDFLFPNRCLNCQTIIGGQEIVCQICMEQIRFHHSESGDERLYERSHLLFPLREAYMLMNFEKKSLARKIIHELKYKRREITGKILAEWAAEKITLKEELPQLITTIPLHPKKLKKRGYNQLHLFAEKLAEHLHIPYDHELILRKRHNKAQALQDRNQRMKNRTEFQLNKNITHQHILLIDDVFTTGNTMASAAWELLKPPGNSLSIFVMALDD
ncbi:double zinc ribbon domain-containing protein [Weeksellaceae bacterium A-14]|uniref:ComF family protein n=1 Tax=Daejeonia sp. YH14 TaxID=3439042 RepID=UPI0031E4CD9A